MVYIIILVIFASFESEYLATTYSIISSPFSIVDSSGMDVVDIRIIQNVGGNVILTETTEFNLSGAGNSTNKVQDLINKLASAFPLDRGIEAITPGSNLNLNASELPPFHFEKSGDDLKVYINTNIHSEFTDVVFRLRTSGISPDSITLDHFDFSTTTDNVITASVFNTGGTTGDILSRANSWATESATIFDSEEQNTNRVMFSNDSDADVVYIDAIANSVRDGTIDSDAINSDLLTKLLKDDTVDISHLDSEATIRMWIESETSQFESEATIRMWIESDTHTNIDHLDSEATIRLWIESEISYLDSEATIRQWIESETSQFESEAIIRMWIESDAHTNIDHLDSEVTIRQWIESEITDAEREESEIIEIVESIDIDFGDVDTTITLNTFSSFTLTTQDYDLGGIRSPRAGYDFGSI